MSAIQVIWSREIRAFRWAFSCGVPVAAFLAVSSWTFVMMLRQYEGSVLQVQSIWGLSIAPWLPILSAVLTMRLFAEERSTGMIDLLMSSPLRERDLVIGKYLSALTVMGVTLLVALWCPWCSCPNSRYPCKRLFVQRLLLRHLQFYSFKPLRGVQLGP